jgi:ATP-binding cassette subfamily B protein
VPAVRIFRSRGAAEGAAREPRLRSRRLFDLIRRFFPFIAPHRWGLAAVVVLTLMVGAMDAVEPLLLKALFDALGGDEPLAGLMFAVASLAGLAAVRHAVDWGLANLQWRVRFRINYHMQRSVVDRLYSLPLSFHRDEAVGSLATRMDRGIQGFSNAVWSLAAGTLPSIVYLVMSMAVMITLEWRLFLLVLLFVPWPVLLGAWASSEQTRRERVLLDRWSRIYSRLHEALAGIATVKAFTREAAERRRFMRGVNEANKVVVRGVTRDTTIGTLNQLIASCARISTVAVGGFLVLQDQATIGTVVAFLGYVSGLFGPVQGLTGIYQTVRRASVALETLLEILDAEDPLQDDPAAHRIDRVRGAIEFRDVCFGYREGRCVLHGIDLRVNPGETIALVGPSGAGKSTLMALLQRLDDPSSGVILVDGADLRSIHRKSYRRHVGVVLQDTWLFNDSVQNNIAYGQPQASADAVEAAARAANAHDFIQELPQGYHTPVGERGGHLSAGQRQRIAIARALLKDPTILILDEPTSALDAESESIVQEALERLMRGRTTFVIAHRLATIVGADRIVVLRSGRIHEIGAHEQLVRAGGYYASLVERQTRGMLITDPVPV